MSHSNTASRSPSPTHLAYRWRFAGVLVAWLLTSHAGASPTPPNILLILVDDLGYGDLSSYGAQDLETPNIDDLVRRGMKWTSFYANCPVCSPTRAALLSGRFPDVVGVPGVIRTHSRNSWGYLLPDAELLPSALRRGGYRTAMVGKWHLGLGAPNLPNLHGFDFFHGFLGDMMDDYYNHLRHGYNYMHRNMELIEPPPTHATDLFTDWACQWLTSHDRNQPFFLYLAYNAPHSPVQPPDDFHQKHRRRFPEVARERSQFAAFVEHLDDRIGQVIQTLDETGQGEDTLVVFTSDNGGSNHHGADNGTLAGQKQDMREGGIRVPMCAVWPGRIQAGSTTDRVAMTMDLYPTLCEAAQASIEDWMDGASCLPTLLGRTQPPEDRTLFWVRLEGGSRYQGQPYYCVRKGPWKLTQDDASQEFELYHLGDDPQEKVDRSGTETQVGDELRAALEVHRARCAPIPYRDSNGKGPGEIND